MNQLIIAFKAEQMKLKRSIILWVTFGLFIFIPLMMALLMWVAQHPEISDQLGLVGAKAQLFSENSWKGYLQMINQIIAVLGVIGFGFVTSWVFGREYLEHTLTDILALPVSRSSIVSAKYLIVLFWCMALSVALFASAIAYGQLVHIPTWDAAIVYENAQIFFKTTIYTILLSTIIGFIASLSRGIIAAIGFVLLMLIMAQFIAISGLGPYFPWAIPGVFTVSNTVADMHLMTASYFILYGSSLAGLWATYFYWNKADH